MHVFIPSKARAKTSTYKLLQAAGHQVTHFVEPQDKAAYQAAEVPGLHVLPANDQGIAFVRNHMLDTARKQGIKWFWMVDDDVNGFGTAKAGKTIKGTAQVLTDFHSKVEEYKFPINGINYCQYAWSYSTSKKRFVVNRKTAEVCTLLYVPKITWQYRKRLNLKEDRDFCMQSIQHSDGIMFDTCSWFNCPGVGTNAGGLQSLYQEQRDHQAAAGLAAEWAPWTKLIKKKNRVDCKLDLPGYAKSLNRIVK